MDLDKSDFTDWLKNPITVELYNVFNENKEFIKEGILNLNPISEENLDKKLAYYHGSLDITNKLLNLSFEQLFITEEEEREDEKTPYSW